MVVIAGVAAAAAAALAAWNHLQGQPHAASVLVGIRQQAGVLAALVNMVNALLDALMLVKRLTAGSSSSPTGLRVPTSFGRDADEL